MIPDGFVFDKVVFLGDTNAEGNVYFARFFDWQGEVREAYLRQSITPEEWAGMTKARARLVTVRASTEYHKPLWFFDEVQIKMTTRKVRHASLELVFVLRNKRTGDLVAEGSQELAFQNRKGKLISIPECIQRAALLIKEEESIKQ